MLYKIIKEYIRRIRKNFKIYLISILGMSIAFIASFQIYHFVYKELSTDKFHSKGEDIYRLIKKRSNTNYRDTSVPIPFGDLLKEETPEVLDFAQITTVKDMKITVNDAMLKSPVSYVNTSFFKLFDFPIKTGSISKFEDASNTIFITEKIAQRFFKDNSPLGELITVSEDYNQSTIQYEIVGIIKDIPQSSSIQGDYFINISNYKKNISTEKKWITTAGATLYIYAPKLNNTTAFSSKANELSFEKLKSISKKITGRELNEPIYTLSLQPFYDAYFNSSDFIEQKQKGDPQFLRIIVAVGLLTLLLGLTNYIIMNLGLNLNRANEFKIKRLLGAGKPTIILQLILESLFNSIICFAITLVTYPHLEPIFGDIIGFNYKLSLSNDAGILISFVVIILLIGLITGILEYILSYKHIFPNNKSKQFPLAKSWSPKKMIITFQLFLFLGLLICILFVGKQASILEHKDLGFEYKNVANISTRNHTELKGILDAMSYINTTSYSYNLYTSNLSFGEYTVVNSENNIKSLQVHGDHNFLEVYQIELLYGENFSYQEIPAKPQRQSKPLAPRLKEILVNEEFVSKANLTDPIGQVLKIYEEEFVIKGVFKNVYNTPLYHSIQPLVIQNRDFNGWFYGMLAINYKDGYKQQLENDLIDYFTTKGADPVFFDDFIWGYNYEETYKNELRLKRLLETFTLIVLFISLLGLVAISLFITETKTKEIGVRKVNGATTNEIMLMLNKDFIKWVGIAFVVACPVSYYAMSKWLESFAYKTDLSWWVFALAGGITLITALITVSWQTYRAATKNPVEALRDE